MDSMLAPSPAATCSCATPSCGPRPYSRRATWDCSGNRRKARADLHHARTRSTSTEAGFDQKLVNHSIPAVPLLRSIAAELSCLLPFQCEETCSTTCAAAAVDDLARELNTMPCMERATWIPAGKDGNCRMGMMDSGSRPQRGASQEQINKGSTRTSRERSDRPEMGRSCDGCCLIESRPNPSNLPLVFFCAFL